MRNIIIAMVIMVSAVFSIGTVLSIDARSIRESEMSDKLDEAVTGAVTVLDKNIYDISSADEFVSDMLSVLNYGIESDGKVMADVLDVDYEKGLLNVLVTQEFSYLNKSTGHVTSVQSIILENKKCDENISGNDYATIEFRLPDDEMSKTYTVKKGSQIDSPAFDEKNIKLWKTDGNAVNFPFTVYNDMIFEADVEK